MDGMTAEETYQRALYQQIDMRSRQQQMEATAYRQAGLGGSGASGFGMSLGISFLAAQEPPPKKKGKMPIRMELQNEIDEWLE